MGILRCLTAPQNDRKECHPERSEGSPTYVGLPFRAVKGVGPYITQDDSNLFGLFVEFRRFNRFGNQRDENRSMGFGMMYY